MQWATTKPQTRAKCSGRSGQLRSCPHSQAKPRTVRLLCSACSIGQRGAIQLAANRARVAPNATRFAACMASADPQAFAFAGRDDLADSPMAEALPVEVGFDRPDVARRCHQHITDAA